jgi:hypothetical protein
VTGTTAGTADDDGAERDGDGCRTGASIPQSRDCAPSNDNSHGSYVLL